MLELTEEQIDFIKNNFSPEESAAMLSTDVLDDVLFPIYDLIVYQGLDDDYLPTKWGNQAEILYDQILDQNAESHHQHS